MRRRFVMLRKIAACHTGIHRCLGNRRWYEIHDSRVKRFGNNVFGAEFQVIHTVSLEDFCRDWPENPPVFPLKLALIQKVADIARNMHQNGMNHRDFYLCHFLLDRTSLGGKSVRIFLIDLHRVQIRQKTPVRWILKDLGGLFFSAMDIGLTRKDLFRFMRFYRQKPLSSILKEEADFWDRVRVRAEKLYRKHAVKQAGSG